MQKTLKEKISFSGIGLFSGEKTKITLHPADIDTGIVFKRTDISNSPKIYCDINKVKESDRRSQIGIGQDSVLTVEHLMSAIFAYGIDNVFIEVNGPEVPIYDGSSKDFAKTIESAGTLMQNKKRKIFRLDHPVSFTEGIVTLIAVPSDEFRISFTLHHPTNEYLKSQYFSYLIDQNTYLQNIAPSRTFSVYEEIKPLLDNNFIKGGSLDNAVVIKDGNVINKEGVRFKDEMVRHKILDLMGDLALLNRKFNAHIIAIRSGHFTNVKFGKKILKYLKE